MIAISIYALTLPITLSVIFDILFLYTGFQLKYFDVIYLLIAYVYMIAAIFMIKYDLMKHTEELKKLLAVQQQPLAICNIENPSEELKSFAIKNDIRAISLV